MRLLVIEDSELDFGMLLATLAMQGAPASAERVETGAALRAALASSQWDLVISDHQLPSFSSFEALAIVQERPAPPPFIIVSGVMGEDAAVEAMRRGADDYLVKGRLARLGTAVRNAVAASQARREKLAAEQELRESQEQLRNLSQRLQTLVDEERAAIGRDIHDEIGGTLTAVRFDLDALHRHLPADPLARLQRAQAALEQAAVAARRIMHDLRPPSLDAGLAAALDCQVRQFRERHGIAARFCLTGREITLAAPSTMAVYRACQEGLTNVARHAKPRSVSVELHYGSAMVSLEVSDDGGGFDAAALRNPGSLGLRGLAERARAAGGALDVSSSGGRTTLMLWLPQGPGLVAAGLPA